MGWFGVDGRNDGLGVAARLEPVIPGEKLPDFLNRAAFLYGDKPGAADSTVKIYLWETYVYRYDIVISYRI